MEASIGHDSHVGLHLIPHLEGLDQRREIGRGSFGAVYEVKMNGLPCIAKGLHDILLGRGGNLPVREAENKAIRAKFHYECALLGNLKHPNIVQFLGLHRSKDRDEWLVMEYLHMDLAKCLEMYPDIPLPLKLSILRDVSYGLLHLHSQAPPIIHRDLTAPNILLTQGMSAKIADLGVSKTFDMRQGQRSAYSIAPGAWAYMPSEALSPDPKYDAKLDVFSYGVLTLYVANQEFPIVYEPPIPPLVYKEIQINKRKHWVDKMGVAHPLYSVVMSCLMDRPDHRPTSKELNDIITKLCAQQDNSCKNVLELIMKNEEHKSQRRKLEMENVLKTQQEAESNRLSKVIETLEKAKAVSDERVAVLQVELEEMKRSKREYDEHCGQIDVLKMEVDGLKVQMQKYEEDKNRAVKEKQQMEVELERHKLECEENNVRMQLVIDRLTKELEVKEEQAKVDHKQLEKLKTSDEVVHQLKVKLEEISRTKLKSSKKIQDLAHIHTEKLPDQTEIEMKQLRHQLSVVKGRLSDTESIMQQQLKLLNDQLNEAREEIAVKVAQVKQYQKQVEAYKQQIVPSECSMPQESSPAYVDQSSTVHYSDLKFTHSALPTTAEPSHDHSGVGNTDDSDDKLPPPILFNPIGHWNQPAAESCGYMEVPGRLYQAQYPHYQASPNAKNDNMHGVPRPTFTGVPHQGVGMRKGEKDDRYGYKAPVLLGRYGAEGLPSQLSTTDGDRSHAVVQDGAGADGYAALDPNLRCPVCNFVFRKGEIQKYKCHVETCEF